MDTFDWSLVKEELAQYDHKNYTMAVTVESGGPKPWPAVRSDINIHIYPKFHPDGPQPSILVGGYFDFIECDEYGYLAEFNITQIRVPTIYPRIIGEVFAISSLIGMSQNNLWLETLKVYANARPTHEFKEPFEVLFKSVDDPRGLMREELVIGIDYHKLDAPSAYMQSALELLDEDDTHWGWVETKGEPRIDIRHRMGTLMLERFQLMTPTEGRDYSDTTVRRLFENVKHYQLDSNVVYRTSQCLKDLGFTFDIQPPSR